MHAESIVTLSAGRLRASVCPGLGAGLADFSLRGPTGFFFPLMRRAAAGETNASLLASFFMAPWVNRIRSGTFALGDRVITLRTNTADQMAQHGDVRRRAWNIVQDTPTPAAARADGSPNEQASVTLEYNSADANDSNWPWRYRVRAGYRLSPSALSIELSVQNDDVEPFPAGCGHHPYFARRLWDDRDDLHLRVPTSGRYPLEQGCSVGDAVDDELSARLRSLAPVPAATVDGCFRGTTADTPGADASDEAARSAELHWPSSGVRLRIVPSANLGHWVVFCPRTPSPKEGPLSFVAVEPQSQANDALNLAARLGYRPGAKGGAKGDPTGTVLLAPGARLETRVRFEVTSD